MKTPISYLRGALTLTALVIGSALALIWWALCWPFKGDGK